MFCRLIIDGINLGGPLPEIEPGAMPVLRHLELTVPDLRTTLPDSWGSSGSVLPALVSLSVQARVEGPLPPQWADGFRQLQSMEIYGTEPNVIDTLLALAKRGDTLPHPHNANGPPANRSGLMPGPRHLPAKWVSGFPWLTSLRLVGLGIVGNIPRAWANGGFSRLVTL